MTEGIHAKVTADTKGFESGMARAESSAENFSNAAVRSQKQLGTTTKSFGLAKNSAQQFGFQIQDVAVQLGAGTNAGIVFAQQGSQIASIFGPGGAVIGAIVAVAGAVAGPFISSLFDAVDAAGELTTELSELEDGFDDLTLAQRRFIQSVNIPKIKALESQINALKNEQEDLLAILQTPILSRSDEELKTLTDRYAEVSAAVDTANAKLQDLQKTQGILGGEVQSEEAKKEEEKARKRAERQQKERDREIAAIEQFELQKLAIRAGLFAQAEGLEAEAELAKHERRMEQLMEAQEAEIISIQEFNALKEAEEERHMNSLADIRSAGMNSLEEVVRKSYGKQAGDIASALGDTLQSMSTNSKKAFELNKKFAIGQAAIKGVSAAVSAWDAGMSTGGPWAPFVAAAYTAASLAKTGAQISSIKSQSFGGGGAGGNAGGSGTPSVGAPGSAQQSVQQAPSESQAININLEGEVFGRQQIVGLIGQINDAVDDGARIRLA